MKHSRQFKLNIWLWVAIIANIIFDIFYFHAIGIRIAIIEPYKFAFLLCMVLGIAVVSYFTKDENMFYFGNVAGQLIMINLSAGLLQYAAPVFHVPLVDKTLIRIDHFLGFDWLGFMKWIDTLSPVFTGMLCASYMLIIFLVALVLCVLFAYRQHAHAQRFFIIMYLNVIVCIILSAIFPAVAGYVFYNLTAQDFHNLSPVVSRIHERVFFALYNHTAREIEAPSVGIITFPSYHAVIAVAMMYASWPLKRLRWVIIPLNMVVLLSTLVVGGHYLTDVVAGTLLALAGIWIAEKILPVEKTISLPSHEASA